VNAPQPILVIESGKIIEVISELVHPNALPAIDLAVDPILSSPAQSMPLSTTPSVIVYVPPRLQENVSTACAVCGRAPANNVVVSNVISIRFRKSLEEILEFVDFRLRFIFLPITYK
jgi:hypothetical protein